MTDPTDSDLIRASRRKGKAIGRPTSELRRWIDAHLDGPDGLIANPPHFPTLTAKLNERGMKDAYGRKLQPNAVARTLLRAKAERGGSKPAARVPSRAIAPEPAAEPFQIRSINKDTP
jgi:hypothetical protein